MVRQGLFQALVEHVLGVVGALLVAVRKLTDCDVDVHVAQLLLCSDDLSSEIRGREHAVEERL